MKKIVLVYGLIAGGIKGLMLLIAGFLGAEFMMSGGMVAGYTIMLLASTMIFFGVRSYREKQGSVSFGRALGMGLLITAVAGVIYVIAWALVYNFLMPDFMDVYGAGQIANLQAEGASASDIAKMQAEVASAKEMYSNPVLFALLTFMEPLPVGIIVSFITALILKRKPQQPVIA
jgi:hypothetical protein